jgi:hypothetical protein
MTSRRRTGTRPGIGGEWNRGRSWSEDMKEMISDPMHEWHANNPDIARNQSKRMKQVWSFNLEYRKKILGRKDAKNLR